MFLLFHQSCLGPFLVGVGVGCVGGRANKETTETIVFEFTNLVFRNVFCPGNEIHFAMWARERSAS